MKKTIESKFEIRLDFKRETVDPSRLFISFAEIIEGLKGLDHLISESVNSKIKSNIILDDIEKGSLIGKFYDRLIVSEEGAIDDAHNEEKIEEFVENSRAESLKFLADEKSSVEDLDILKTRIEEIAEETEIAKTFNYSKPDILKLAKVINNINDSTEKLSQHESYELKSNRNEVKGIKTGTPKIDIEAVEDSLTEDKIINDSTLFYLIKKPDFLGDSAWGFKLGKKAISVKILDEKWIKKFHAGQIVVVPGDSLKVLVRQTSKYNRNRYLISEKLEILEVLDVIHNSKL
ncbi:hypothetical protein [Saccharicrinis aurantiacus]|uniref:hypothetical protein n=1 Tax=Saccharicrinis aurantiacus TaxID=1849719 RepID=UPI0008395588|nr:hypothetical protein [Saccharicrinis aurantiacus]